MSVTFLAFSFCLSSIFERKYVFFHSTQIPENNEEFTLRLTGATKGARVLDTVMTIIIQANDAPIRFQQVGGLICQ